MYNVEENLYIFGNYKKKDNMKYKTPSRKKLTNIIILTTTGLWIYQ